MSDETIIDDKVHYWEKWVFIVIFVFTAVEVLQSKDKTIQEQSMTIQTLGHELARNSRSLFVCFACKQKSGLLEKERNEAVAEVEKLRLEIEDSRRHFNETHHELQKVSDELNEMKTDRKTRELELTRLKSELSWLMETCLGKTKDKAALWSKSVTFKWEDVDNIYSKNPAGKFETFDVKHQSSMTEIEVREGHYNVRIEQVTTKTGYRTGSAELLDVKYSVFTLKVTKAITAIEPSNPSMSLIPSMVSMLSKPTKSSKQSQTDVEQSGRKNS